VADQVVYLTREQLNAFQWDTLIAGAEQGIPYGYSWYLDAVAEEWGALVWPSAEQYTLVLPLPYRKKWGLKVLYQPHFCQFLGFFWKEAPSDEALLVCLNEMLRRYDYVSGYCFEPSQMVRIRHLTGFLASGISVKVLHTHTLDLQKPYSEIAKCYTADRRRNLRIGKARQWEIVRSQDPTPLISLFKAHHASKIEGNVAEESYTRLTRLVVCLKKYQKMELLYALNSDQKVCAGVLLAIDCGRVIYLFNAANTEGRRGNARTVLLDDYIRQTAPASVIFDFESPEIGSIADFYKSFGAAPVPYLLVERNRLPVPLRQLQQARKGLFRLLRKIEARF
jgi:hypothetical protein